jgi:hypothetical protein
MLWTISATLLAVWLVGWGFPIAGALIHLQLVISVLLLIINIVILDDSPHRGGSRR